MTDAEFETHYRTYYEQNDWASIYGLAEHFLKEVRLSAHSWAKKYSRHDQLDSMEADGRDGLYYALERYHLEWEKPDSKRRGWHEVMYSWVNKYIQQEITGTAIQRKTSSLDAPAKEMGDDGRTIGDMIGDWDNLGWLDNDRVRRAVDYLDERDRQIVQMRFGLDAHEPMNIGEIAKRVGMSPDKVTTSLRRSLRLMRYLMTSGKQMPASMPKSPDPVTQAAVDKKGQAILPGFEAFFS